MEQMDYYDDGEYRQWLFTLSKEDVNEILYDFFCCLDEQEEELFTEELNTDAVKRIISIKFHKDSVLYDIDKEVAELSYQILKTHYPKSMTKDIRTAAKLRGFK